MEVREGPPAGRSDFRRRRLGGRGTESQSARQASRSRLCHAKRSILLSPWTDLTVSGSSVDGNRRKELWFTRKHLETWASYYVGRADARSPYLSPVFAELSGLPPLLLLVGEDEVLLDDALRVRDAATSVGTDARVLIGKGMQHDWPLTLPWLDESRLAWNAMRGFVEEHSRLATSTEPC